jgi:hypothetical protein
MPPGVGATVISTVLWNLGSIAVGALITWYVSWRYYRKAGEELQQETAHLKKLAVLNLRSLEEGGLVTLNRGANGEIVGLVVSLQARIEAKSVVTGSLEVHRGAVTSPPSSS